MILFNADGTMNIALIISAISARIIINSPRWIVPSGTQVSTLYGGYKVIEYNGPQPKLLKV